MLTQDQIEAHFSGWLPTSVNINALPEGVRDYIHRLEANTDPQGEVKRAMIAEMQLAAVNKMLDEAPEVEVTREDWLENASAFSPSLIGKRVRLVVVDE